MATSFWYIAKHRHYKIVEDFPSGIASNSNMVTGGLDGVFFLQTSWMWLSGEKSEHFANFDPLRISWKVVPENF